MPKVTPSGKPGNVGTAVATVALAVDGEQQWICEAVVPLGKPPGVVLTKPLKVALTVIMLPSMVTTALPMPGEVFAGTSFVPLSVVVKTNGSAFATPDNTEKAATKTSRPSILFIT